MSHRILLVDDEVDILEFVRYNLVREGYEVFTAENGAEALKIAAECRPHLILLDMMMPVMDGAQTCRAIRANPLLKDTMVVFLSALGEEGQQLAGFGVGADDYLTKPIKMKLLVSRDPQADRRRQSPRKGPVAGYHRRPRALYRHPRRAGDHPAAQGVRTARPALLVARETDSPRGDLRQDMGHGGRRGRPYDRRAHPQTAPEDRRRAHRHGQRRRIQVRTRLKAGKPPHYRAAGQLD